MSQKVPITYIVSIISSAAVVVFSIGFAINRFIEDVSEESRANAVVLTITENEMVEWCESKVLKTFKNHYSDMTTVRDTLWTVTFSLSLLKKASTKLTELVSGMWFGQRNKLITIRHR